MLAVHNHAKERLEAGKLALGVGLRQARTVDIAKIMKTAGYDFLFIDTRAQRRCRSTWPARSAWPRRMPASRRSCGCRAFEHFHASRALDAGAQGIVVPHVDTAEIAARMVDQLHAIRRSGHRSVTGALPQIDFASWPLGEATAAINAATLVVVMLETPLAIDNVEAIAAVPGLDVLLVGANDLCLEMGIPGQLDHPRVVDAFERIVAACRGNGKYAGLGGVYTPRPDRALCGDGLSLRAGGQRSVVHARRRQGARRGGARNESPPDRRWRETRRVQRSCAFRPPFRIPRRRACDSD